MFVADRMKTYSQFAKRYQKHDVSTKHLTITMDTDNKSHGQHKIMMSMVILFEIEISVAYFRIK